MGFPVNPINRCMRLNDLLNLTLTEAPIGDIQHIGNWDKNSSFGTVDRRLVTNPVLIQRMRTKFAATSYDFQIFFANNPEGRKFQEIGQVDSEWLMANMPSTAKEFEILTHRGIGFKEDSINIIFTNNTGAQRVPMTAWMMAHRIGHALRRTRGSASTAGTGYAYTEASKYLINGTTDILENDYGIPTSMLADRNGNYGGYGEGSNRRKELLYRAFWHHIGTFRSARDGNLREEFEMLNELVAQYITQGEIRLNPLPETFQVNLGGGWGGRRNYRLRASEDQADTGSLAATMEYAIGDILSNAVGHIYVM